MDEAAYLRTFIPLLGNDPTKTAVKLYGEVYTPLTLVEEMLDTLPITHWRDPKLQWLEPAAGLAPFLFCAYRRLMAGLTPSYPDPSTRARHILETMFTFQELQPKNVKLLRQLFAPFTLQLLEGDYLTSKLAQQYDVVVGNPPYQRNGSASTGNTIWDLFLRKALEQDLAPKGYLLFIHPPMWRKPESEKSKNAGLFKLMAHCHHLQRLVMASPEQGKATFGCSTRYDWYCLSAGTAGSTRLRTYSGEEVLADLRHWTWLPNDQLTAIRALLATPGVESCPVIFDRSAYATDKDWTQETADATHPYPVVRTTNKAGVRYLYSSKGDRGHYQVPKVIFGDGGAVSTVVVDLEGNYGLSEHAIGIEVADATEAELVKRALLSPLFAGVLEACVWSTRQLDWRLFRSFRRDWYRHLPRITIQFNREIV
jgi:Eco57I restriction-modification methylase